MATRQEELRVLIEPAVIALGCQLWGLEYLMQGKQALLRVYIDRSDSGVSVEDCERVSRQASSLLDVEDLIKSEYTLEVSSPGLDRPLYTLAQFEQYVGEDVSLKLRFPYEGRRKYKGRLSGVEGEDVLVITDGHEYLFPVESIEKANVVPRF
ncbi:MAG: ribosome maturation factor RimP [Porticoccaceae bacterium]|nr:ribosome maturation factor RimP [Pseudomonadales bacterium]MCP5170924.1 ribosome maturation factor RimP [Pseudomonadales bacterium]MCP5301836.1 ribosome maturation factor RimP [Pseudomonadales bacterium]